MAKDDESKSDRRAPKVEDPDRAAILARRQRFIAIALSGLTTGTACARSEPCLNVALPPDEQSEPIEPGRTTGDTGDLGDTVVTAPQPCLEVASPQPCLDVIEPTEPEPSPQPCLKVAAPEPEPPKTTKPKPRPQPCLRVKKIDPE